LQLLPSSTSKRQIYDLYVLATQDDSRVAEASTFDAIWRKYLPKLQITKAMSDLCWECQQNSTAIVRSQSATGIVQSQVLEKAKHHVDLVQKERQYYQSVLKNALDQYNTSPSSTLSTMYHYSFDFAQQVHFPSNPLQPGPIYLLTPRKCGIFGVCCEAAPRQVNYLIDEAFDVGKGLTQ
jgi:hypothetical protein